MQRCTVANQGEGDCCCFFCLFLFFAFFLLLQIYQTKKTFRVFGEVFCSNDFWPLRGYALRARWAFSSTTKAGFKKLHQAAQTNPLHMSTHTRTRKHTPLCALDLAARPEPLRQAIPQDLCTTTDKQEHLRHVGRKINMGEPRRNYQ